MNTPPKNPVIKELWQKREKIKEEMDKYTMAIHALQRLCDHVNEEDISRHGSADLLCPDCGNRR